MSEQPQAVRLAIVDDHPIFRDGLRRLLESEPGFTVVAEGADGLDAVRIAREAKPDVLLLDIAMPRMDGVNALSSPELGAATVVVLTAGLTDRQAAKVVELGARGIVLKESATRLLVDTIRGVMDGRVMIAPDVAATLAQSVDASGRGSRPYRLTAREAEIVNAIADGKSNREIAEALGISLQTVKHHLTSVFDKTGTSSRLELALVAIKQGFAAP
ncbi:MAG TPA: response regulator transcription factor [Vicinamibacterales bacterium]|nr:response regulator transcription factor [Vicinamibacterales bacterium]